MDLFSRMVNSVVSFAPDDSDDSEVCSEVKVAALPCLQLDFTLTRLDKRSKRPVFILALSRGIRCIECPSARRQGYAHYAFHIVGFDDVVVVHTPSAWLQQG